MGYKLFRLAARDWMICCGEYIIIISIISYLFYDSVLSFVILLPFCFFYAKRFKRKKYEQSRERLEKEFLQALQYMANSLAAGYSPENALADTIGELERTDMGSNTIIKELEIVNRHIISGKRMEDALFEFAGKSGIEAIRDFALVFSVSKKSGGSYTKAIVQCMNIINTTKQTEEEMRILIRGKQYEQRIKCIVPQGIILYISNFMRNIIRAN